MFRKKFTFLAITFLLILSFAGCKGPAFSGNSVEPQKWAQKILTEAKFTDQLTELDTKAAAKRYSAVQGDIAACAVYVGTGATAEEISVFKMKDAQAAEALESNAKALVEAQKRGYADYRPSEVPKLTNAVVEQQDSVVVLCVSADDAKAKQLIDGMFGGR